MSGNCRAVGAVPAGALAVALVLALVAACAAAAAAPSSASAAIAGWTDPVDVSPAGHDPYRHAVLVAPDRRLTAFWLTAGDGELWSSDRAPGQPWGAARRVSPAGTDVEWPGFAIDDDGNVTVVWRASQPDGSTAIESVYRPHDGTWGAPVQVAVSAAYGTSPRVAVDDAGRALALWVEEVGATEVAYTADRAADGSWSEPVAVSDPEGRTLYGAGVSIGLDGDALATWIAHDEFERRRVHVSSRPAGGEWSAPVLLSDPAQEAQGVTRHIGPSGAATLVWRRSTGGGVAIESATRPPGGVDWSEPVRVSAAGDNVDGFTAAANAAGDLIVVWQSWHRFHDGTLYRPLSSSLRPAGGEWSPPALITDGPATGPRVTLQADGDAFAVWQTDDHSAPSRVRAAAYSFGSWRQPTDVLTAGDDDRGFAFASHAAGEPAVLAWLHGAGGHRVVRAITREPHEALAPAPCCTFKPARPPARPPLARRPLADPTVRLRAPRQRLRRAVRAGVLRAACRLSAPGICRARAQLPRRRAERLGIRGRRRGNRIVVAAGRAELTTRGVARLRLRLPRRTRISLRRLRRPIALRVIATVRFSTRGRAIAAKRLRLTRGRGGS